jgi:GntR family transcriptional regulator/MocR family aminotransferase
LDKEQNSMLRENPSGGLDIDAQNAAVKSFVYKEVYDKIRTSIVQGDLPPGGRLPSSRTLAEQLSVSRGTVQEAYAQLAGEGYVVGRGSAGTFVLGQSFSRTSSKRASPIFSEWERVSEAPELERPISPSPFRMGLPALDEFPRKLWARLLAGCARGFGVEDMLYKEPGGIQPLRQALANYVGMARGVSCISNQIIVTAGFQGALSLIVNALLVPGDPVWVEDPGYFKARQVLKAANARLVPVSVDRDGINVADGVVKEAKAKLAVVTPANQCPLGSVLSAERRLALLSWAKGADAYIVEDDYDSEYRFNGPPLPALKSQDEHSRVIYVGTFSKVLFPGIRLGYIVLPDELVEKFKQRCFASPPETSRLTQQVLTEFLVQGHFGRHLSRMRKLYAERNQALHQAVNEVFGRAMPSEQRECGMYLLVRPNSNESDITLARRAVAKGLAPEALSIFSVAELQRPGLLLSFSNLPADAALDTVRSLRDALQL